MSEKTGAKLKSNFLVQGSILALAGLVVRIIGLIYRIPLRRIVGEEGMGYYSFAFSVYAIILLLSSYSLPLAVSKMISVRIAANDRKNAVRIFQVAIFYATIVGALGCAVVYFGADLFARVLFKTPLSLYALKTLAPTVWIMAYLGVFRGYYQGHSTMIPTALSQLIEQLINAAISIIAAKRLTDYAISQTQPMLTVKAYGAAGGTIGTGAGALSALLLLIILFIYQKSRTKKLPSAESIPEESYYSITIILCLTVIPVILSTAIYNINGIIDGAIFGNMMEWIGRGGETAREYGIYTSEYLILINVPVAISNALASSLIPTLSRASAQNNVKEVNKNITDAIRFSMIVAMPAAVGLAVLSRPILELLFSSSEMSIRFMRLGSIAVVFASLSTVSNAILQGTSHMGEPVKNVFFSLIIHILLLLFGILYMGAYGLVFANIVFLFLLCVFNARSIRHFLEYRQEVKKIYIMPAFSALLMGGIVFAVYFILDKFGFKNLVLCALPIIFAIVSYPLILIFTGTLTKRDLNFIPGGNRVLNIMKKLHLFS